MRGVNMDQDEAKRKESRTVVWIVLAVGLVFLGLAFLIPYDSMVAQIIRGLSVDSECLKITWLVGCRGHGVFLEGRRKRRIVAS
jgi:hypothetical protein